MEVVIPNIVEVDNVLGCFINQSMLPQGYIPSQIKNFQPGS